MPWKTWLAVGLLAGAALTFALGVHPFLTFSRPVPADVLVVEGWVPDHVLAAAVQEFKHGRYARVFVSGLDYTAGPADSGARSYATEAAAHLAAGGIDPSVSVACPGSGTDWNRTSNSTRVVRDRMRALGVNPKGINIVTMGPHAPQTLLAYRRLIAPTIPVGGVSIPKDDYDPARSWASRAGIKKVTRGYPKTIRDWRAARCLPCRSARAKAGRRRDLERR